MPWRVLLFNQRISVSKLQSVGFPTTWWMYSQRFGGIDLASATGFLFLSRPRHGEADISYPLVLYWLGLSSPHSPPVRLSLHGYFGMCVEGTFPPAQTLMIALPVTYIVLKRSFRMTYSRGDNPGFGALHYHLNNSLYINPWYWWQSVNILASFYNM